MNGLFENGQPYCINERGQKVDQDGFVTSRFTFITNRRTCVSVKIDGDKVQVRDTKDPSKITLTFRSDEWETFIRGAKAGEFDI